MINSKTIWLVNFYGPLEGENWREYSFNQFGKCLSENRLCIRGCGCCEGTAA